MPPDTHIGPHLLSRLLGDWSAGPGRTGARLAGAISRLVRTGLLPQGSRLPSERALAEVLGLARSTVTDAYDLLRSSGAIASRTGAGTYVTRSPRTAGARGDGRLHSFADAPRAPGSHRIDLRSAALPAAPQVREELLRPDPVGLDALLGGHGLLPEGLPALREAVARYHTRLGLPTGPEQVLVTSGAQQAMRLLFADLLDPGGCALVEEPTYRGAIEALRAAGARVATVPSGPEGAAPAEVHAAVAAERPALVLLQTTVHNPTGSVLPEPRRRALADLGGARLIDHSAPRDTLIDGPQPTPVAAFAPGAITVGSAAKGFWGGLRVGWIRADPGTVRRLAEAKGAEDLGSSLPAQLAAARLLDRAEEARAHRAEALGRARGLILEALADRLPDWRPQVPAGGASLWVALPPDRPAPAFAEHARAHGVDLLPGPVFSARDGLTDRLRLAYSAPAAELLEAVDRLASAWRSFR
ncbi:aminotransferase-like domain-containing protein [Nocardiopsis potens]|uniref:aminotransferase-like domain-containing protein n=1 Tax=Nocardiopsis potens TaxID=1246458 RepID=UPI000348B8F1|nr:PLP-dependent aminotransferase family protein [Nocardiopsis potens]